MSLGLLFSLLGLGGLAWYWYDTMRARENVLQACARSCERHDVQFLDQTVALAHTRLARLPGGMLGLRRHYRFEFSIDGVDRHEGEADTLGQTVLSVHLGRERESRTLH